MFRSTRPVGPMRAKLIELEHEIAQLRAEQVVLINELERSQAPLTDASRSMVEYVQSNADIDSGLARDLVYAARTIGWHRDVNALLAFGRSSFDRVVATLRYARSGASSEEVDRSSDVDLEGVRRLTASRKRTTRSDERTEHAERYFVSQPSLDRSHVRFWGRLGGVDGCVLERAMVERADELRHEGGGAHVARVQRQADAMVCMAMDSLDRSDPSSDDPPAASSTGTVTVFLDARAPQAPEHSARIEFGPQVGPDALDRLLCAGSVSVVGMDGGTPVSTTASTRRIPPAIRHVVAQRDGGCTVDGCRSRYRLEPHHIVPFSRGGSHDPSNLTTPCWYHHHVAVHQEGYRIDPASPARRRRLFHPDRIAWTAEPGHDPP